ncbi:MAG: DUF58 domain-containing protein [Saprospiraceae bacterium]|nr:DUF58 domain-containing protein [Saprospiraceae bacterium]
MEVKELLSRVRKIELKSRDISRQLFNGDTLSFFKGRGMSFAEVREYQYSDDVRFIDWNVTARTGVPYVKIYEEEHELNVILMVDISKSTYFGTDLQLKNEIIAELCAVLAFSALESNNKVGLILFTDEIEYYIPPGKGRNQILRIIRQLVDPQPKGITTDLNKAIQFLNNVVRKNSICFIISDFLAQGYKESLRIAGRKHDVIAICVDDKADRQLPDVDLIYAIDPEDGSEYIIDTKDSRSRKFFAEKYAAHLSELKKMLGESKIDLIQIDTNRGEDYIRKLIKFFKSRS